MTTPPKFFSAEDRARWIETRVDLRVAELRLLAAEAAVAYGRANQKTVDELFDAALRRRGYCLGADGSVRRLRP